MKEIKKGLPVNVVQFLIDRIPQEEVDAAVLYFRVLRSREADPALWFDGDGLHETKGLPSQRKDLLFRSLWCAENHVLSLGQVIAIFRLDPIFREELGIENNSTDLYNWINALIDSGDLHWQNNLLLKLSRNLEEKAKQFTRMKTYS